MTIKQIGTVEILRPRIYPDDDGRNIWVDPGTYPVVHDTAADLYYFQMEGSPSKPSTVYPLVDIKLRERVPVTSKKLTKSQFVELKDDPVSKEGHDEQRLRFYMYQGES